ncbi:MAG TPA: T6SS effector amidase Tae4 family protein [Bosea sp. (in: a-proteobacteria)]|jgi:hypothetical protein|nr:T6SS effector amidase Tae4 family protein [Bosea sp. (in: a-proteobacteria)]
MAYAKIPLSWDQLRAGYKTYNAEDFPLEIKNQLKTWNDQVEKDNGEIKKNNELIEQQNRASGIDPDKGKKPLKGKNTSCVMQLSLGLNSTADTVPQNGAKLRQNTYLMGQYMILSVDELHDWLDWQYGRTDAVPKGDLSSIKGKRGILVMGSAHVELWDGDKWLQAMDSRFTTGASAFPYWFWEVNDGTAAGGSTLPGWLLGWWEVYDGNYYYYHFAGSGRVTYIKSKVASRGAPAPKAPTNVGKAVMDDTVHGPIISWAKVGKTPATVEKFTRLNWTSETDMNGRSNNYGELYARRRPE